MESLVLEMGMAMDQPRTHIAKPVLLAPVFGSMITVIREMTEQCRGITDPATGECLDRLEYLKPLSLDPGAIPVTGPAFVMVTGYEMYPAVELLQLSPESGQAPHADVTEMPYDIIRTDDRVPVPDDRLIMLFHGREAAELGRQPSVAEVRIGREEDPAHFTEFPAPSCTSGWSFGTAQV